LFHAGGLLVGILGPMIAGMRTIFDRQFSVSNYWRRVRKTQATIISPAGVALTLLCRQPPSPQDRDHCVRASLGVTGQLPEHIPSEFSRRFGVPLANVYSLTEASGALTIYNPPGAAKPEANGIGRHWADVAVVDAAGQPLPPGQVGNIVLRPKVPFTFMLGYHNNPAATVKSFSNLWLNTGDLGFLDDQGFLYFRGREAHWLRRRGENISAYEVESIISQYPGIAEVTVVGVPSELGEEEVKAFIITEPGRSIDLVELSYWCLDRMAAFKIPRFFEIVQQFPRSAAKREVERHVLRQQSNAAAWDRELALGRRMQRRAEAAR
jgi:crotonobetaine/carnitine-CoA ligase